MKRFMIAFIIAITTLSFGLSEAQAKRFGGGRSFGKQSQNFNRPAPSRNSQYAAPSKQAAGASKPASPWRGILGGALLGLGLGALLSHFGIGGALAGMISTLLMLALLAMAAVFIVRMLRRSASGSPQPAYAGGVSPAAVAQIGSRRESTQPFSFGSEPSPVSMKEGLTDLPPDFDEPAFVRTAKTHFIRLQAAWDRADIDDLGEFTTPEVYAEMKLQLHERGASPNHTDVVSLEAELLGMEIIGGEYLASVKFSGTIREAADAPAESFMEIWNLARPVSMQGGWLLAGVQQIA